MDKPTIPKGTRDFGPAQMAKRQFIFDSIRKVFQKYGFQPLETPAMEKLDTLTGKYGEEGDQLLFKILNNGDFLAEVDNSKLETRNSKLLTADISGKGLRYDLTVPFARYVVMNRGEITFPFKRYQIQPVWRADRPQKGRYREFYQCDADVVGTDSLICEAEIVLMIKEVFKLLGIKDFTIKINHRAILSGLAELTGSQNESSLFVAIDKLDKIGEEKVKEELRSRGFDDKGIDSVFAILNFKGTTQEKIDFLKSQFSNSEKGKKGIADFEEVLSLLKSYGVGDLPTGQAGQNVEFDISLARGLSYYTGCIFEVKINNVAIGSVSGGGRYDNLTGVFGLPDVSGVGISFGVDRLYDAMEELKIFPKEAQVSSKVMIAHFDDATLRYSLSVAHQLRESGISTEVYLDVTKLKKQLDYANKKEIPYVIVVGSDEMKDGMLTIKNMKTGEQEKLLVNDIALKLK
jgi:histidyl-tRNA synthetase